MIFFPQALKLKNLKFSFEIGQTEENEIFLSLAAAIMSSTLTITSPSGSIMSSGTMTVTVPMSCDSAVSNTVPVFMSAFPGSLSGSTTTFLHCPDPNSSTAQATQAPQEPQEPKEKDAGSQKAQDKEKEEADEERAMMQKPYESPYLKHSPFATRLDLLCLYVDVAKKVLRFCPWEWTYLNIASSVAVLSAVYLVLVYWAWVMAFFLASSAALVGRLVLPYLRRYWKMPRLSFPTVRQKTFIGHRMTLPRLLLPSERLRSKNGKYVMGLSDDGCALRIWTDKDKFRTIAEVLAPWSASTGAAKRPTGLLFCDNGRLQFQFSENQSQTVHAFSLPFFSKKFIELQLCDDSCVSAVVQRWFNFETCMFLPV